jgi:hypothetical protein
MACQSSTAGFDGWARRQGQQRRRLLQIAQGGARDLEQLAIVLNPFGTAAGKLDRPRALLRCATVIVPCDGTAQRIRVLQQMHHRPHGVP